MAPALARRTRQPPKSEGRPKRKAVLNRKRTPGAPKKSEPKEVQSSENEVESDKVKKSGNDSNVKDTALSKEKTQPKNQKKSTAQRSSPRKKYLLKQKTPRKNPAKTKTNLSKTAAAKNAGDNKATKKSAEQDVNEEEVEEEIADDDGNEKTSDQLVGKEQEVEEEHANEIKLNDEDKDSKETEDSQEEEDDTEAEEGNVSDDAHPDDGEMEDDEDEDFDPDNDPEKLWCFCQKPHSNRFMICCDVCEDWFHGDCVGISMKKGREMEKTGEEWCCKACSEKQQNPSEPNEENLPGTSPLNSPFSKKASRKDHFAKKARSLSLDSMKNNLAKLKDKNHSVSENIKDKNDESGDGSKDREEEGSKEANDSKVQRKHSLDEKQSKDDKTPVKNKVVKNKGEKAVELPGFTFDHVPSTKKEDRLESKTGRKRSSTDRRDSISQDENDEVKKKRRESFTSKTKIRTTPTPKPVEPVKICLRRECGRAAMKSSIYCSRECIFKYSNEVIKEIEEERKKIIPSSPDHKTSSNGSTIISPATSSTDRVMETTQERIAVFEKATGKIVAGVMAPTKKYLFAWLEEHQTYQVFKQGKQAELKQPKKDQDEVVRNNVRKSLCDILVNRCKETMMAINLEAVGKISKKIEQELLKLFGETGQKYKTKYRSLIFNLKDQQNKILYKRVVSGEINPSQLVHMSPEDLATPELARWREQESKHHIEMVKKREQEAAELAKTVGIKKTHKGEVEINADNVNMANLEIRAEPQIEQQRSTSVSSDVVVNDLLKDTTEEHAKHLFDSSCRICTGKMAPPGEQQITGVSTTVVQAVPESSVPSPEDDSILLSSPSSPLSPDTSAPLSPSSPVPISAPPPSARKQPSVWRGFVMMQKVAKFVCTAYAVSGTCENLMETLPDTIHVCGRIPPGQVWEYISQMKEGRKSQNRFIDVIRFEMSSNEEKAGYIKLYTYFYTRQRIGVVGNCYSGVKDMYILPLASHDPIPEELKPLPGLPTPRPHMLLGVIVRVKPMKAKFGEVGTPPDGSSPEMVAPKKKKKKKEKKLKEFEKERVEGEAQKKLLDIIFKSRVTVESDSISTHEVSAVTLSTDVSQAISDKDKMLPKEDHQNKGEIDEESQDAVSEDTGKKDVEVDFNVEGSDEEQLSRLTKQKEEIERLKQEIGSSNQAIDRLKNEIDSATSDEQPGQSKISTMPMTKHILTNVKDSPLSTASGSGVKPTNSENRFGEGATENANKTVGAGVFKAETIPFMSDGARVKSNSSMAIPFMSSEDTPLTTSVTKQIDPRIQKRIDDDVSQPCDDDYVASLINNIKIPVQTPKFPLELIKEDKKKEIKVMPELPAISLPLRLPLPGEIPKVPLPPNIRLPPGVPFPPLPPKPIPSKVFPLASPSTRVPDAGPSPDPLRGNGHVLSDPRITTPSPVREERNRGWDERRENVDVLQDHSSNVFRRRQEDDIRNFSGNHAPSSSEPTYTTHRERTQHDHINRFASHRGGDLSPPPPQQLHYREPTNPPNDLHEPRVLSWRHKEEHQKYDHDSGFGDQSQFSEPFFFPGPPPRQPGMIDRSRIHPEPHSYNNRPYDKERSDRPFNRTPPPDRYRQPQSRANNFEFNPNPTSSFSMGNRDARLEHSRMEPPRQRAPPQMHTYEENRGGSTFAPPNGPMNVHPGAPIPHTMDAIHDDNPDYDYQDYDYQDYDYQDYNNQDQFSYGEEREQDSLRHDHPQQTFSADRRHQKSFEHARRGHPRLYFNERNRRHDMRRPKIHGNGHRGNSRERFPNSDYRGHRFKKTEIRGRRRGHMDDERKRGEEFVKDEFGRDVPRSIGQDFESNTTS